MVLAYPTKCSAKFLVMTVLAAAFVIGSCGPGDEESVEVPRNLGSASDWFPLKTHDRWLWESTEGNVRIRTSYLVEGSDVRDLADEKGVEFQFVYGTQVDFPHPTEKCIFAMASTGPREFYLDANLWELQFDPPLKVLPVDVKVGAEWSWSGSFRFRDREAKIKAALRIEALESVTFGERQIDCVRVRQDHDDGLRIMRWYSRELGLVKVEIRGQGDDAGLVRVAL